MVGPPKTPSEKAQEQANLHPSNIKLQTEAEDLDSIRKDLVRLSEKEIQTIMEEDEQSIQTERGKTWLENSGFTLRTVPDKDQLMLTRRIGNTTYNIFC